MGDRGREPAAELSVAVQNRFEYPQAPADLPPEAKVIWDKTVKALPQDWFRPEVQPTLEQYCKHVMEAAEISRMIQDLKGSHEFSVRDYNDLLRMQERETRAGNALARSMRITLQATVNHKKTKDSGPGKKLWEK